MCDCNCKLISPNSLECNLSDHTGKYSYNPYNCSGDTSQNATSLKVICKKYSSCQPLPFRDIFDYFNKLESIEINACALNFTGYVIEKKSSSVKWNVRFDHQKNTWSSFAFFFKLNASWAFRNPALTKPCTVRNLTIRNTIMYRFPLGLVLKCDRLQKLFLHSNDLTVLDVFDFASILSRQELWFVDMESNSLLFMAPKFIQIALTEVHSVLTYELQGWFDKNKSHLSRSTKGKLKDLITIFRGWTNRASPLYFDELTTFIKDLKIDIDFIFDDSPLSHLLLNNNRLKFIPICLVGFNNLTVLEISNNYLKYSFERFEQYVWFPFQNSLQYVNLTQNRLEGLPDSAFIFLKNVQYLHLDFNHISFISPRAFSNNSQIQHFSLANNRITMFDINKTIVLPNLQYLNLSNNRILSLTSALSNVIPNIICLDLSFNILTTIAPFHLQNLTKLKILNVGYGKLQNLPARNLRTNPRRSKSERVQLLIENDHETEFLCDCFSVFPKLVSEFNQTCDFQYPWITWSPKTRCFNSKKWGFNITNQHYFCTFTTSFQFRTMERPHVNVSLFCPKKCHCSFEDPNNVRLIINCTQQNFTFLPAFSRTIDVHSIFLSKNSIESISINELPAELVTVRVFNLSSNRIVILGPHIFQHLTNLTHLDVSDNPVHFIDFKTFYSALNIVDLLLNNLTLHSLPSKPFEVLKKLKYLRLSVTNNFICHCMDVHAMHAFGKGRRIVLAGNCSVPGDDRIIPVNEAEQVCLNVKRQQSEEFREKLFYIGLSIFCFGASSVTLMLLFYGDCCLRLRAMLDASVRSRCARKALFLCPENWDRQLDVAIFAHERQTADVRFLLQRLAKSTRHSLICARVAARLPGAMPLSNLADIAHNTASFVVFLSQDLLEDDSTRDALWKLLTECEGPRIVLILADRTVVCHDNWPVIALKLGHWPLLQWHDSTFWMRFLSSLPAPKSSAEVLRMPPILSRRRAKIHSIGDVCVVAMRSDIRAASRLINRYRGSLRLCFLCRDRLYGVPATEHIGRSLSEVLALSPQILVLVSPDFLRDSWNQHRLVPALKNRLRAMTFRGSVILIEMSLLVPSLCRTRRFSFYDHLRRQAASVTLAWSAVEADWSALTELLVANPNAAVAEDVEFDNMLRMPPIQLEEDFL